MAQTNSVLRPGIDRLADAVEDLEREIQRRRKDVRRRLARLEKTATRRRRSLERSAQRGLRRLRRDLRRRGDLRLPAPRLPDLGGLLRWTDALRPATRRDVKETLDPVERRVNQLSRRVRDLEGRGGRAKRTGGSRRRSARR